MLNSGLIHANQLAKLVYFLKDLLLFVLQPLYMLIQRPLALEKVRVALDAVYVERELLLLKPGPLVLCDQKFEMWCELWHL